MGGQARHHTIHSEMVKVYQNREYLETITRIWDWEETIKIRKGQIRIAIGRVWKKQ